jgi:DNA (cytosine-5)-methyltransferase 1
MLTHFSICTGIGGVDLACEWAGFQTVGQVEYDPKGGPWEKQYNVRLLNKKWPNVPKWGDVKSVTGESLRAAGIYPRTVNLVSAGIPCQPYSVAGKQEGNEDDRAIWPEVLPIIRYLQPDWVLIENVNGFIALALDGVWSDLEAEGYTCQAYNIPACAVGAPHERMRIVLVAHTDDPETARQREYGREVYARAEAKGLSVGGESLADYSCTGCQECNIATEPMGQGYNPGCCDARRKIMANPSSGRLPQPEFESWETRDIEIYAAERPFPSDGGGWPTQPGLGRDASGLAARLDGLITEFETKVNAKLDSVLWPAFMGQEQYPWEPPRVAKGIKNRVKRLKALGNMVNPVHVYPIVQAIHDIEMGV